jgi:hypothetical protein
MRKHLNLRKGQEQQLFLDLETITQKRGVSIARSAIVFA